MDIQTHSIRIPGHARFKAVTVPLEGIDSGLFEASVEEAPTLSEYAGTREEALALLKDALITTLQYAPIRRR